jgi:hypothetical protein
MYSAELIRQPLTFYAQRSGCRAMIRIMKQAVTDQILECFGRHIGQVLESLFQKTIVMTYFIGQPGNIPQRAGAIIGLTGQSLIQATPESKHITCRIGTLGTKPLRCHIQQTPHDQIRSRLRIALHRIRAGDTEIQQAGLTVLSDPNVSRLDIPMNETHLLPTWRGTAEGQI